VKTGEQYKPIGPLVVLNVLAFSMSEGDLTHIIYYYTIPREVIIE